MLKKQNLIAILIRLRMFTRNNFIFQGKTYLFDKVLKPNITQEQVYVAAAKSIVKGKNVIS